MTFVNAVFKYRNSYSLQFKKLAVIKNDKFYITDAKDCSEYLRIYTVVFKKKYYIEEYR